MSNYPPGVTGNEYQIAGPDYEETQTKTCDQEVDVIPRPVFDALASTITTHLNALTNAINARNIDAVERAADMLKIYAASAVETADEATSLGDCNWQGSALVEGYNGSELWQCDGCGHEHEYDVE